MSSAVIFQLQSACILILMYVGVIFRHQRRLHIKLMGTAMLWDLALILQIELTRSAIGKASESIMGNKSLILNIHVSMAIACLILYALILITGRKLLAGKNAIRTRHRRLGFTTLILRTFVFGTSFFAVTSQGGA